MTSGEIKDIYTESVMNTYGRFDVVVDHGEGARVYSPEGNAYIDFTSGIGVNCLGYGDRKWAEAIFNQALKLQHISNLFYTQPGGQLAHELTARTGMKSVFFCNSGAEANEGAIKLARKYAFDKYGAGRSNIVTLRNSFHGRTITTLAATGQDVFHNYFFPFTEGFRYVCAGDIDGLRAAAGDGVCAVMIEMVQGEGGVIPLERGFVSEAAQFCRENDVLLIVDEVQTGIGRTGTLFAYQQYGIEPDIVTFAKGIAGGIPMAGMMADGKCSEVLTPGTHAATFGGNPVAAAGALEVLSRMTPQFLDDVGKKGAYIRSAITSWGLKAVREVRGMGLMLGVSVEGAAPKSVAEECIGRGLLILTAGCDAVRMLPPLTITFEEIDAGLEILKSVLEEVK